MRKIYLKLMGLFLLSILSNLAYAVDSSSLTDSRFFKIKSYIDGSLNYLSRSNRLISGLPSRFNDQEPNGFALQQAAMTIAHQPADGLGGLLNFLAGRDAKNLAPYGMDIKTGIQNIGFAVTQAYLQYAKSNFMTALGEMDSLAGYENYNPTTDTNFSRSIISSYAEPGTFLGARETYSPNDQCAVFIGINNGWDTIEDTTRRATIEVGTLYTLNSKFSFSLQGYNGQQRATDGVTSGPTGIRTGIDFIATYNPTDKLTYAVNYDYGIQNRADLASARLGTAIWQGAAGYINYKWTERWQSSLRGEIFSDHNGFRTGVQQTWKEATITLAYFPIKKLTVHLETRRDFSNVNAFLDKNGQGRGNNLQSFGLEMLYVFS